MALLDEGPEPDELVAFLTRRFAPPSLENTEGDPLSDRRMDGVLDTIQQLDPAAAMTSDERLPISDAREAARLARELPSR
jgi:hypothetical protein